MYRKLNPALSCGAIALMASATGVTAPCHAAPLPPSGDGWTLTESGGGGYAIADQVEGSAGWSLDGGSFVASNGAVTPQAGTQFYQTIVTGAAQNRGLSRSFTGVPVQAGDYEVTFDMADFSTTDFPGAFTIQLAADLNEDGTISFDERIKSDTIVSETSPDPDGGWQTWTFNFTIEAGTATGGSGTVPSAPVIGERLGFRVLSNLDGSGANDEGFGYDNLNISFTPIPEPASMSVVALSAAAMLMLRRH